MANGKRRAFWTVFCIFTLLQTANLPTSNLQPYLTFGADFNWVGHATNQIAIAFGYADASVAKEQLYFGIAATIQLLWVLTASTATALIAAQIHSRLRAT